MNDNGGTFNTDASKSITLETVTNIFRNLGAKSLYIKKLAPNDNSKNQIYFGSHLNDLPFIPTQDIVPSSTKSNKRRISKREIKYQADVNLTWVDADSQIYDAPHAKLIYYPQYPEVRFSGFLTGSTVNASEWMNPSKKGREAGRWLILGVTSDQKVYAYLVTPKCALSQELTVTSFIAISSTFSQVNIVKSGIKNTRTALLSKLMEIHQMDWIQGQRLNSAGLVLPHKASNAGGTTLESLLGILPNSKAEPDYLGWEVKSFSVKKFPRNQARTTTLMTPEPDGGYYKQYGVADFVRNFGYPDKKGIPGRMNFGGRHFAEKSCASTNLTLNIDGFDSLESKITDACGAITLTNTKNVIAASWSFAKVMKHWNVKHSKAVYVPVLRRPSASGKGVDYHYGSDVELGIGTSFERFLSAMSKSKVYYDPGIKLENESTDKAKAKKRSQFRTNHKDLDSLYTDLDFVDITSI